MSQPQHPEAGHPEPAPEPGPPQPIPLPEPAPVPEPPHAALEHARVGAEPHTMEHARVGAEPHTMELQTVSAEPLTAELHLPELRGPQADGPEPYASEPYASEPYTAEPYITGPSGLERPPAWPLPVDPERTWHLPPPPSIHRGAHEANWPAAPGQRQWQPEPHHDGDWHPRHEQDPGGYGAVAAPDAPAAAAPAPTGSAPAGPRRTALWVSSALALTLLLCGGGAVSAFLLLRNADSGGAPDPSTAVTRFLSAVYAEQDADAASDLVCREARDTDKVAAKVDEVRGYSRQYDGPQFRWAQPAVSDEQEKQATVSVEVTMTTRDEKTAEQQLTFTVVKKTGWWVCEVAG